MSKKQRVQEHALDLALIRDGRINGRGDAELRELLGCTEAEYGALVAEMLKSEAECARKRPTEEVYAEYLLNQARNVHDLTSLLDSLKTSQATAFVSAVRARADIFDRIIARGQEFGFVHKQPDTKLVAGIVVDRLSNTQLRAAITRELAHLDNLMARYGDVPLGELDAGDVYALPPSNGSRAKKGAHHGKSRVHGGRRVSRKPTS